MQHADISYLVRPDFRDLWHHPLPFMRDEPLTRLMCRAVVGMSDSLISGIEGLENVAPHLDPFVLTMNHNQKLESIILPTLLIYHRMGKLLHFMADWNFMMVPFIATLYRRSQVVVVAKKDAKPKFLNVFRPLFRKPISAFDQALERLSNGGSVGIFPEGTINRDPSRLMRGRSGAALMALRANVPVVPLGIRFPNQDPAKPIKDGAEMSIHIGEPITYEPAADPSKPAKAEIDALHARIMTDIATLSGKQWSPNSSRRKKYVI